MIISYRAKIININGSKIDFFTKRYKYIRKIKKRLNGHLNNELFVMLKIKSKENPTFLSCEVVIYL